MLKIAIETNSDVIVRFLDDVAAKQVPFAAGLAMSRTAKLAKDRVQAEMRDVFDRPTPFTINSVYSAFNGRDEAVVGIKDQSQAGKGVAAATYLQAAVKGGTRRLKGVEAALRRIGELPAGDYVVPGAAAKMDAFGNMSRGQIVQILSYLQANRDSGTTSNSTAATRAKLAKGSKKKYGTSYFVGRPKGAPMGVWMREHHGFGVRIRPVLIFVLGVTYEAIFDFHYVVGLVADKELGKQFDLALAEALRTARS